MLAYLSLGSNLGDREQNLAEAMQWLECEGIFIQRRSSLYETEPQDVPNQPWFLNMVLQIETSGSPAELLQAAFRVETGMGRRRIEPKGPRLIDIDILLYGEIVISTRALDIPHPRMTQRRFVLEPLVEIAPRLMDPKSRRPFSDILAALEGQAVRRLP